MCVCMHGSGDCRKDSLFSLSHTPIYSRDTLSLLFVFSTCCDFFLMCYLYVNIHAFTYNHTRSCVCCECARAPVDVCAVAGADGVALAEKIPRRKCQSSSQIARLGFWVHREDGRRLQVHIVKNKIDAQGGAL